MERAVPNLPADDLAIAKDFYVGRLGSTSRMKPRRTASTGLWALNVVPLPCISMLR
jgi:hypothetical protein